MFHPASLPSPHSPGPHTRDMRCNRRLPGRLLAAPPDSRRRRARWTPNYLGRLLVAGAAIAPGACTDAVGVQEFRVVGQYDPNRPNRSDRPDPYPEVPRTMKVGTPSEVTIWTVGNTCVRGGDTEVFVDGRKAVVTPYDILKWGGGCWDEGMEFEHKVNLTFHEPGTWNVVFRYSTGGGPPSKRTIDGWSVYQVEVLE